MGLEDYTIQLRPSGKTVVDMHGSNRAMNQQMNQWVETAFYHMGSICVGMTRADLLRVFREEGGCHSREQSIHGYRECPWFKVNVIFRPVPEQRDEQGRLLGDESPHDVITAISAPYLAPSVFD